MEASTNEAAFAVREQSATSAFAETPPRIHLSAIIAWGCYIAGLVLATAFAPSTAADLGAVGRGACVLLLSFVCFIALVSWLQREMGIALSANQTVTPGRLCTSGLFRHTRNPIYLAFILPLAAIAFYSPLAAALSISLYVAATTRFVIRTEESLLRTKFGAEYDAYARSTPRWLIV